MPITPLVQFKAGTCVLDDSEKPWTVKPRPAQGFIYLYREEDFAHFCWRPRGVSLEATGDDALDLIMLPGDGYFAPWNPSQSGTPNKHVNGRIYRLGFRSSREKHFFWLQSKPQGGPDHWSEKDYSLGRIVSEILNGEDVDAAELYRRAGVSRRARVSDDAEMRDADDDDDDEDDDDDLPPSTGGAGAGATGGNVTEEGEGSRQGGEDGARASTTGPPSRSNRHTQADAQAVVADLLRSLEGHPGLSKTAAPANSRGKLFTTLPELLKPESTLNVAQNADEVTLDDMLAELPPQLLDIGGDVSTADGSQSGLDRPAARILTIDRKREILVKALRSPQFAQSLAGLTAALRDGGLPTISEALKVDVENGGYISHGRIPLGGGEALKTFLDGIREAFIEDKSVDNTGMDTDG